MNWESFYLTCFLVGLLLTIASFVFGTHFHLPNVLHLHFHMPHAHAGHGSGDGTTPFNLTTVLMFLTWFGGAGYVMTHGHSAAVGLAFTVAVVVGFAGGAPVYLDRK